MATKERKNEASWSDKYNRWQINVQRNGKRKSFYSPIAGRKGKIEAERKADAWLNDGASEDPRVESVWSSFLDDVKRTTSTGNYRNTESQGRVWILPGIKAKRISSVTLQDFQDILTKMFEDGKSKKYILDVRGVMTAFYQYCRRNRLPLERPDSIKVHKDAPKEEKNIMQPDQLRKLFSIDWVEIYGREEKCFFIHAWRFLVLTGMRRGELLGLRKEDIQDGVIYIRRAFNALGEETSGKTENAQRYIVLNNYMKSVLQAQEEELKSRRIISPWIFPDENGRRLDGNHLSKKWSTYRRQHEIDIPIYGMRHTLISVAKADVPIELLKGVVGHSAAMDTTGVYGHEVDGEAYRASGLLDDIFNRLLT